jgi:adenylate cyclase
MVQGLSAYIPEDRRHAMARGEALPDRTTGSALFADLSGFTPMTEALTRVYGPHRGAEELTRQLGFVFGALIDQVALHRGSVIGFSGDAITCWFDGDDDGLRATAASLAMQGAMERFAAIPLAGGEVASLRVKTAVVVGPVRRFLVGDPDVQLIDAVAGDALDELAEAERLAESGEVVVSDRVAGPGSPLTVAAWRVGPEGGRRFAVVEALGIDVPEEPWPELDPDAISPADLGSWVLPGVYERLQQGLDAFLADFRPAAALFLSFHGIDYDGDDDAGAKLDRFVRWVQSRIAAYEGSLIQLTIGDKGSSYLYASFGAPIAHDDDAARAVAVALEIQALAPGLEHIRDVRIGVTHGQMYAGAYGSPRRKTYGVLGAKTNLSARLMGKAQPGQILCDGEVVRRASRAFSFTPLGTIRVKGKEEEVPIASPSGRIVASRGSEASDGAGPLIGRGGDLEAFDATLDALARGAGRVSFLEGEAGIGKTTLVRAVVQRARDRGMQVLVGAGSSGAQQLPYHAWCDVFTALLGLSEVGDDTGRQTRALDAVADMAPELVDLAPLLNDLLPLGLGETPVTSSLERVARQEALGSLLVALVRSAADHAPLTILLEDAHWLDSLSWELAERVARSLLTDSSPLWLLIVHRPLEDHHVGSRAASALHALPQSDTITLGPLVDGDLIDLVIARLGVTAGGVPPEVAAIVRDRANGNPFIAEELIQTLRDQGMISLDTTGDHVRCRVAPALAGGQFSLPDTLQGLILSRIDRLPADRQLVLKVASVIGRLFTMSPLRDTLGHLGWAARSIRPALLRELTRRGFVLPEGLEPELRYLFRHVITHEIVYQTLLFAQRRQVHQALAEWYERTYPEIGRDLAPVLAHHWGHAAEESENPTVLEKAATYLMRAGGHADQLAAYPEAIAAYDRALELLPTADRWAPLRAKLAVQLGAVRERLGEYARARADFDTGLALARVAGDPMIEAQALDGLGLIARRKGDYAEAEVLGKDALAIATAQGNRAGSARAWVQLGTLAAYQSHFDVAIERLEAALPLYEELGDRNGLAACVNSLGVVATLQDDFAAAAGYFERALALARELGDREGVGMFLSNLGVIAENREDYEAATRYYQEGLQIGREINARQLVISVTLGLGDVAAATDQRVEAFIEYDEALHGALEIGALPQALLALCGLAVLDRRAGRYERSAERLGLVLAHPAINSEVEPRAKDAVEALRGHLTAVALEAALARGATMTLEHEAAQT